MACNRMIEKVATAESTVFVNGWKEVPADLEHLEDSVHLTDKGRDVLARAISKRLLRDAQFRSLVDGIQLTSSRSRGSGVD